MFFYTFIPKLLNMSLTASVAIVFVILLRLLLKNAPKVISYALWSVVLFRLLCPVSIESAISLFSVFHTPTKETSAITNRIEYIPNDIVHPEYPAVTLPVPGINDIINDALPQGREQLAADPLEAPMSFVTYIWMTGVLVMCFYAVHSYIKLRRQLLTASLLHDNIYLADDIPSPFVMGLLFPKIYLPSSISEKEQPYIILHEQHHIRRFDHIIKILGFLALTIHWFNPFVWLAFNLACKDMEMSCDEAVIKKLGDDVLADYTASLLNLAIGKRFVTGVPLAFGEGDTKGRIRNLIKFKKPAIGVIVTAVIACAILAVCLLTNPASSETIRPEITGEEIESVTPAGEVYENKDSIGESSTGEVWWEYVPYLSSKSPVFQFTFDMPYTEIAASCDNGELVEFNYGDNNHGESLIIPANKPLCWSPLSYDTAVDAYSVMYAKTVIQFTVYNGEEVSYDGTLTISLSDQTGYYSTLYTAALESNELKLSPNNEYGGGIVSLIENADTNIYFGIPLKDLKVTLTADMEERDREVYSAFVTEMLVTQTNSVTNTSIKYSGAPYENYYSVADVDKDGKQELLINYCNASGMVDMSCTVYDYDHNTGEIYPEESFFPQMTFYDNGYIKANASHNHGRSMTEDFWPYELYKYEPEKDTYTLVNLIDMWQRDLYIDTELYDDFPKEQDLDGDGIIYYDMRNYYHPGLFMDNAAYEEWCQRYQEGNEIEITWYPIISLEEYQKFEEYYYRNAKG